MKRLRHHSPHRSESGFTLVELLIATALLSLLTLLLFSGLRLGTRAWERSDTAETAMIKIMAAQHLISDTVASAYPFYIRTTPQEAHVEFVGSPHRVMFLAPAPRGGMDWVTIGLVQSRAGFALALWKRPELSNGTADGNPTNLISGLSGLTIDYFGAPNPRDPPQWRSDWNGAIAIPLLIRFRASMADTHSPWPELVIATHTMVDQGCVFDQLTKYCQGRI